MKYPSKPTSFHKGWKKEKEFGEKIVKEIRFYTKDIVHNPNGGCFNSDYKKKKCSACKIDELCQRVELYYTDLIKPL